MMLGHKHKRRYLSLDEAVERAALFKGLKGLNTNFRTGISIRVTVPVYSSLELLGDYHFSTNFGFYRFSRSSPRGVRMRDPALAGDATIAEITGGHLIEVLRNIGTRRYQHKMVHSMGIIGHSVGNKLLGEFHE